MSFKKIFTKILRKSNTEKVSNKYLSNFYKYSFIDCECKTPEQFEASIIRLYHTIEKGLSYDENYRPGFGKENVNKLIVSLEQYIAKGYDIHAFFYETALSCLDEYIKKNAEFGYKDSNLEAKIHNLPGNKNNCGGTIVVSAPKNPEMLTYEQLMISRHSIRHFAEKNVQLDVLIEAVQLAQHTPSACNRQGWKTRIIVNRDKIKTILLNQNGNTGFGNEFDKLLVITSDLRAQQRNREVFQAFIDGGMYAQSVLNCLYCKGIGSVPLSASLTFEQDNNIRNTIDLDDAEVLILIIGVGNYPEGSVLTTRSERKKANIVVE